ncbi:LLM class flavin-dependent oxidoreductase [Georgenia alba]|uniref:LLM class flavin-dependent oxidoreductase n=1 Tax=Georgenia alba TaxID=2233858 RepID=A0ABW2QDF4_9MICO
MTLQVGTGLPAAMGTAGSCSTPSVAQAARAVEQHGFESLWAADVLIGDGTPSFEPVLELAAAASVTEHVRIGTSVLAAPARPLPWLAVQAATMQHLSGGRFLLGLGIGGFPGSPFWQNLGIVPRGRGRALDGVLERLPRLLKGEPVTLDPDVPPLLIAPSASMPTVLLGGSARAFDRILTYGTDWFPSLVAPQDLAPSIARLHALADGRGVARPRVTVGGHCVIGEDDGARTAYDALVASLVEEHGMPPEVAARVPMHARTPLELAEIFAAYEAAGADRVVTGADNAGWFEQLEFLAEASSHLR